MVVWRPPKRGALLVSLLAVLAYRWWARPRGHVLSWKTALWTTFWGALTHVYIDAASHYDMERYHVLFPPGEWPGYEGAVDICFSWGVVGAAMLAMRWAVGLAVGRWRNRSA